MTISCQSPSPHTDPPGKTARTKEKQSSMNQLTTIIRLRDSTKNHFSFCSHPLNLPTSHHPQYSFPFNCQYGCCFHRNPPRHPWPPLLNPRSPSHQSIRSLLSAPIQLPFQLTWVSRHPLLPFSISSTTSTLIRRMLLSSTQSTDAGVS